MAHQAKKSKSKAAKTGKGVAKGKPKTAKAMPVRKAMDNKGAAKAPASTKKAQPATPKKRATGTAKKSPAKKATAKKTLIKKTAAKNKVAKKVPANKAPVKKTSPKKVALAKAPVGGKAAKKVAPTKPQVKKAPLKTPNATKAPVHKHLQRRSPAGKSAHQAPAKVVPAPKPAPLAPKALKQRYQLEFYLNASQASLYELISTPSGFSEWFCDDVDMQENRYTFKWGDEQEQADCISQRYGESIRFRWVEDLEEDPAAYFELRIRIDGMTNETCLVVTDHAWPQDLMEEKALWEAQVQTLIRVLGA
ncbi:MAG TPA: START-like domain-containing protein [Flavobacteriales bacterium]|nr:START-like domain-containing protein [Flavobacteriales bacterium]HRO39913.1 START-like domain-containing protein [Flavobacteriales bacterium]HRP80501.1 START-like domain-containing protein [Flavobacteriales bacterium]HRQ84231.1 START-like domain-containing protein [Flavobacteriales bacterium]